MAAVTVTGNVFDHSQMVIPASKHPELWFRPLKAVVAGNKLLPGVEVKATLNPTTGAFSVVLENPPGLRYQPLLRWVLNPSETLPEKWAWARAEWLFDFLPGQGGALGTLLDVDIRVPEAYYFGPISEPPPPGFRGWWEVQAEPGREDSEDPFIGDVRRVYGG